MNKRFFFLLLIVVLLGLWVPILWAPSPPLHQDRWWGETLHVEVYPPDTLLSGLVRVPMYVTHRYDPGPVPPESLAGFLIPLCFTHTNPTKYCSVSYDWNNLLLYPFPDSMLKRSIFRHFIEPETDTIIHNWMMDLSQPLMGLEWDHRILDLDDSSHFWLSLVATGMQDLYFWEMTRTLLATITFRVEDTMTICIDSCFWPPSQRLLFSRQDHQTLTPEHNLPYCFSLTYPTLGDVNADGAVNVGDVVYLVNYLYREGNPPTPWEVADVNCDGVVNVGDVVFLVNYLFRGGEPPNCRWVGVRK